jgi:hypothetical protein
MEDDVLSSISNALLDNCTLKSLSLCGDGEYAPSIDGYGEYALSKWVANRGDLFQLLLNPDCALEILDLNNVGLNNDSIMCLRNALANNFRLRELRLTGNHDVTTYGWVNFLTFPRNAKLEKLVLGYNDNINDQALDVFKTSLTNNCKLKELHFGKFPNVTTAGWTAFSAVLCNPNSLLEKLDVTLQGNSAEDKNVVTSFADALTNNKRLRELSIYCRIENFAPFTRIVCNSSSIMSTYNSNHILSELNHYPRCPLPIDLASALQINRDCNVSQAARLKIIKTHFSGRNIITTPFTAMDLKVLPNAISWMGRECGISDLLFAFVRSMPSLCDTKSRCKKRKFHFSYSQEEHSIQNYGMYAYTIGLLTSSTSLAEGGENVRMPMDNRDNEAEDSDKDDDRGRGENNMDDLGEEEHSLQHYGMYAYTIGLLTSSTSLADGDENVRMPMDNRDSEVEDSDKDDDIGRGENNMDDLGEDESDEEVNNDDDEEDESDDDRK